MQQIADWLEKLGMSEYAQRFLSLKVGDRTPDFTAIAEHVPRQVFERKPKQHSGGGRDTIRIIKSTSRVPIEGVRETP